MVKVMGQDGDEEDQIQFRSILADAPDGNWSIESWQALIIKRSLSNLSVQERVRFDNATRIYPTNLEVNDFNFQCLGHLNKPVAIIRAENSGYLKSQLDSLSSDKAGELHQTLHLSIGARIMLR
jgi:hypothetical protein